MTGTMLIVLAVLVLAVGLFVFRSIPAIQAYFAYRGKRLITCPETHSCAAVDVAAGDAALGEFLTNPTLHLKQCSRWPERENCGQECLQQIEVDTENCLVWNVVSQWYEGKNCALCHKPFGKLSHLDHAPGLLDSEQRTVEWRELRPELLPEVFSTHQPVCWNCHVAEVFRRLHPELVTDREPDIRRVRGA
ncbi:MAG: hypothetical protein ACLQLC_21030 [Candidatus Sulfotelmatobacter sp.]